MYRRLVLHLSMGREGVNSNPAGWWGEGQSLGEGEQFCHHGQVQVTHLSHAFPQNVDHEHSNISEKDHFCSQGMGCGKLSGVH